MKTNRAANSHPTESRLKKTHTVFKILAIVSTIILGWSAYLYTRAEKDDDSIAITIPSAGATVPQHIIATGDISSKNKQVVVFVQSVKTMASYRQGDIAPDGKRWQLPIVIGNDTFDPDESWIVMAFAVDPAEAGFSDPHHPPKNSAKASVTIKRSK